MSDNQTCTKCDESTNETDSDGRCKQCSTQWPPREYTGPATRAEAVTQ